MTSERAVLRNVLRAIASKLTRSFFQPARRDVPVRPLRAFVGLPIVFDLVSLAVQLIDLRRSSRIKGSYGVKGPHHRAVHDYNAAVTVKKIFTTTRRMDIYYRLLALSARYLAYQQLLIVGPRNRHELLSAWVHGFAWENISAIDLYSTHPKIQVMNMESMTWPDDRFDSVAMANTLSYSEDTRCTIAEVGRVVKPGGSFSFSATYDPASGWIGDAVHAQAIVEMLHKASFEIRAHFAEDKVNSLGRRQTSHTFLARKRTEGEVRLDKFSL